MSQLQTNLTNLQEILDKVNNLPENGENNINLDEELAIQKTLLLEQEEKIKQLSDNLYNKLKAETCTVTLMWESGGLEDHPIYYLNQDFDLSYEWTFDIHENAGMTITVIKNSIISISNYSFHTEDKECLEIINTNHEDPTEIYAAAVLDDCTLYF